MSENSRDAVDIDEWDRSYDLAEGVTLWGNPPVPYVLASAPRLGALSGPILELPCGDGRNTIPLAQACDVVVAADSSQRALGLAARRLRSQNIINVCLVDANVFDMPFPSASFAGALCWDLLGHLRRPDAALAEMVRTCQVKGLIIGNVFSTGDSTLGEDMSPVGPDQFIYQQRLYFCYYNEERVRSLTSAIPGAHLVDVELVRWTEGPHEGYREYEHDHESWAFILEVD